MALQSNNTSLPPEARVGGIENRNFLSPIGFRFSIAKMPGVDFFCQAANIPEISMQPVAIGSVVNKYFMPGDELTYSPLFIRFLIDENMKNWLSIYDWITALGFPTQELQKKRQLLKEKMELKTDAILTVLTSNMNAQMNFKFQECFPINLSAIQFDSSLTDVEYVTADVSFRYDIYQVQNLLNNEKSFEGAPINRNA